MTGWSGGYGPRNVRSLSELEKAQKQILPFWKPYNPWNSPGQNPGMGNLSLLRGDLPNPGIEPRSPVLQVDSLTAEPQGKHKNTGVSSLSLLQWIFLTQELNQGLLHCRWILYHLSYQGSKNMETCSSWNSPGQNTGVGILFLLQGIFPIWGLNPGLPHCRLILCQLSHKGSTSRNVALSEIILDSTTEI